MNSEVWQFSRESRRMSDVSVRRCRLDLPRKYRLGECDFAIRKELPTNRRLILCWVLLQNAKVAGTHGQK